MQFWSSRHIFGSFERLKLLARHLRQQNQQILNVVVATVWILVTTVKTTSSTSCIRVCIFLSYLVIFCSVITLFTFSWFGLSRFGRNVPLAVRPSFSMHPCSEWTRIIMLPLNDSQLTNKLQEKSVCSPYIRNPVHVNVFEMCKYIFEIVSDHF